MLQEKKFIPKTERTALTYPRNGVIMCKAHHALFDAFYFFIRYIPEVQYPIKISLTSCLGGKILLHKLLWQILPSTVSCLAL